MAEWLLVETFGGRPPTVLAVGNAPKKMVPLDRILRRERDVTDVLALLARVVQGRQIVRAPTSDGQRQMIGEPLLAYDGREHGYDRNIYDGRVQGVWVWLGRTGENPPPHNMAGSWTINLTRGVSARSDELLDLYRASPGNRKSVQSLAELFANGRLRPGADEAAAIALMVEAQEGDEHHATWTTVGDDGTTRAGRYSYRALAEANEAGDVEIIERGITHDTGPAESSSAAPTPARMMLAERVLDVSTSPGTWRAIWDLHHEWLIKWIDEPAPTDIVWQYEQQDGRGIHWDDRFAYRRMQRDLSEHGETTGTLRFRSADDGWTAYHIHARLMLLNQRTTSAFVTLTRPVTDDGPNG
jgi:hypothetical protein